MTDPSPGRLVVVARPPAGLEPSARAAEVLATVDRVEADAEPAAVVARVAAGDVLALVSDGAPASARLVGAVVDAGLGVEVVPAPMATIAALVASGLATDHVAVEGSVPGLATDPRTTALSVAGAEVAATLRDVAAVCGPDRPVAVVGSEVWRGTAADAAARSFAGDVVLVVGGAPEAVVAASDDDAVRAALRDARARGLSPGRAAAEVAAVTGRPRRDVYALGAGDT